MKRLLILLALIFVPIGTSWAQQCTADGTQLARLSPWIVGGGVPAAPGTDYDAEETAGLFSCSWDTGSDVLNAGDASHDWASQQGEAAQWYWDNTASNGWQGSSGIVIGTAATDFGRYVISPAIDNSPVSVRFAIYVDSETITEGVYTMIFNFVGSSGGDAGVSLLGNGAGTTVGIVGFSNNGGLAYTSTVTINHDTWYQVCITYTKNTNPGVHFRVDDEDGTTPISDDLTVAQATVNENITSLKLGLITADYTSRVVRFDIFNSWGSSTLSPRTD